MLLYLLLKKKKPDDKQKIKIILRSLFAHRIIGKYNFLQMLPMKVK